MRPLMTPEQVAERLHIQPRTLEAWRRAGKGPAYVRPGKFILYRPEDVEAWEAEMAVKPGGEG